MLVYLVIFGLSGCSNSWRTQFQQQKPYYDPEAEDMTRKTRLWFIFLDRVVYYYYYHYAGHPALCSVALKKSKTQKVKKSQYCYLIISL